MGSHTEKPAQTAMVSKSLLLSFKAHSTPVTGHNNVRFRRVGDTRKRKEKTPYTKRPN